VIDLSNFCERNALIDVNACSIGFKSGEYGGRNRSLQPLFASVQSEENVMQKITGTHQLHLRQAHEQHRNDECCSYQE
jgi:hypothetical protein